MVIDTSGLSGGREGGCFWCASAHNGGVVICQWGSLSLASPVVDQSHQLMGLLTVGQPIALKASRPAAAMLVIKERIGDGYPVVSTDQANAVAQVEVMQTS
ncbi:hypothetical protein ACV1C9_02890 [Aeromonas caviae]